MKITINKTQVSKMAQKIKAIDNFPVYDFYSISKGIIFPPRNADYAIDYFFASVLHQFGFWFNDEYGYVEPLYDTIDGIKYKGSDFLWRLFTKQAENNPAFFDLPRRANYSAELFKQHFSGDRGLCNMPMIEEHYKLAVGYAADMIALNLTPKKIVVQANAAEAPELYILDILKKLTGYKEDPLQKKSTLLILTLANRPEHFIKISDEKNISPIVDYHIQRSALRTGLVKVTDLALYEKLKLRLFVSADDEAEIRKTVFDSINMLSQESGKSIAAIDFFFYNARLRCPEMTEPQCKECEIREVCEKNKELFQPVFRTTYY